MNIITKKTNGNINFCIKTNVDLNSITNFVLILLKLFSYARVRISVKMDLRTRAYEYLIGSSYARVRISSAKKNSKKQHLCDLSGS